MNSGLVKATMKCSRRLQVVLEKLDEKLTAESAVTFNTYTPPPATTTTTTTNFDGLVNPIVAAADEETVNAAYSTLTEAMPPASTAGVRRTARNKTVQKNNTSVTAKTVIKSGKKNTARKPVKVKL